MGLSFTVAQQTKTFLLSIALGGALAAGYDVFRIRRLALPLGGWLMHLEDLCFCLFGALCTFWFLLDTVDGRLRWFVLLGELLGAVLYRLTVGSWVMACSRAIVAWLHRLFYGLYRLFVRPVVVLFRGVLAFLQGKSRRAATFLKKNRRSAKYRLKRKGLLVYNFIKAKIPDRQDKG